MFGNIEISDYENDCRLKISINASWITVVDKKDTVFVREPKNDNWYDPQHVEIVEAMNALEKAVLKACAVVKPEVIPPAV